MWPDVMVFALESAGEQIDRRMAELRLVEIACRSREVVEVPDMLVPLARNGVGYGAVRTWMATNEANRIAKESEFRETVARIRAEVVQRRIEAMRTLEGLLNKLRGEVRTRLRVQVEALREAIGQVEVEAGKVGVEMKA